MCRLTKAACIYHEPGNCTASCISLLMYQFMASILNKFNQSIFTYIFSITKLMYHDGPNMFIRPGYKGRKDYVE